jgi:hypothetical protein
MNYRQPFEGEYPITQGFGKTEYNPNHTGIDYGCPTGTPILASEAGTVIYAGWRNGGYGYCVFIQHADGNITIYEHLLDNIPVKVGETVRRSQVIGYSGSTGNSTGPHLHFEMRDPSGKAINPLTMLHSSIEPGQGINKPPMKPAPAPLKGADQLGEKVEVVCTLGAKGWYDNFTKYDIFPQGTDLTYTGKTKERNGYTYCEVYPAPRLFWVAVNDGDTQILDDRE